MPQNYTPEFKKKIVRLHEEEGRTYKSITAEYGVSTAGISKWCRELREECQTSPETKEEYDSMKENLRLKRENDELKKEIAFLKKAAAIFLPLIPTTPRKAKLTEICGNFFIFLSVPTPPKIENCQTKQVGFSFACPPRTACFPVLVCRSM